MNIFLALPRLASPRLASFSCFGLFKPLLHPLLSLSEDVLYNKLLVTRFHSNKYGDKTPIASYGTTVYTGT
jgi:hypothetical protein